MVSKEISSRISFCSSKIEQFQLLLSTIYLRMPSDGTEEISILTSCLLLWSSLSMGISSTLCLLAFRITVKIHIAKKKSLLWMWEVYLQKTWLCFPWSLKISLRLFIILRGGFLLRDVCVLFMMFLIVSSSDPLGML